MSLGFPPRKSSRSTSTFVVRPGLKEFISLISQDFYVAIWSCVDDWKLRHVLEILFPSRMYQSFQFTWGHSRCTNTRAFISKKIPYLLKEYKTLQYACSGKSFSTKIKPYLSMTCPVSVFEILLFQAIIPSLGAALTLLASSITSHKPFICTSII